MDALLLGWLVAALLQAALWGLAVRRRDAGLVDVGWAASLALLAPLHAALADGLPARRLLVGALGAVWGVRLTLHLVARLRPGTEDPRYAGLRARWGDRADRWFLPFFQAQALLAGGLALAFALAARSPRDALGAADLAGAALWLVAVLGEALADRQLARFRADPANAGRTCRAGLWGWSRHPNYFFEWLHWLAYVPLAWGGAGWYLAALPAAVVLLLVLTVTGIPPTEAQALRSRGEDYRRYQRTTSAFFPWPPRRGAA